jgi:N-dimethylarginine dimethylaminohydrolase
VSAPERSAPAADAAADPGAPPAPAPVYRRSVLMGDPSHFSVQGGANPHTRTRLGARRTVDRARAIAQWHRLRDTLRDRGLRVVVVPADPGSPGLVYPANAGFLTDVDAEIPIARKTFFLSNLIATRAAERMHYERLVRAQGYRTAAVPTHLRFEGEADFFPAGDAYLFTHGRLEVQRFVPHWGLPPWRRVYGFRSDARAEAFLAAQVAPRPVLGIELVREEHYHGDTALCAFGADRGWLLAWRPAIAEESFARLQAHFGDRLLELSDDDAGRYAANSFTYTPSGQLSVARESFLFLPAGVSDRLQGQLRERGVSPVLVDVSEFLAKGGGSVKCMIGDLGPVAMEPSRA